MTPTLILHCSIVMAWCFADESTPETVRIQDRLAAEVAVVPWHWFLEVANVLAMAEKRKRISSADSQQFVQLLSMLDIQVDEEASRRLRRKVPLASLDDALRQAATSLGLKVLGK